MHSLTICFGPTGTVWNLLFKEQKKADELYNLYYDTRLKGPAKGFFAWEDDFGQKISMEVAQVHAILLEDLDQSQMGQIERGLHNARSQAKAQQRAMGDPTIKTAAMAQGPAVMSPFANGGGPRFNG